ncbi:porphobilinogen deaminase protein [Penicillium odoratum]|uniref:porphobilinogen deaminase protein n=1 Tax=Penicillium odoratum TaxID=1167516 RepID=UPI0025488377|nr:porphobilinogen deaminase protein [Penicillium odoratum]KAJ5765047.1 porphobilinogen deaminase protein [Penicillium odoratum]
MAADASAARALKWKARNYTEDLPDDIGPFRELLENYSNIPPEKVNEHLHSIRDKGWAIHRYPCIGRWSFTNIKGLDHPSFQAIVKRLTQPGSQDAFLDVACCVGQVLRKLAFDGVDPARLYGTDISSEFLDLGFELFNDREKFRPDSFVAANILDPSDEGSKKLDGKVTLINAGNFFHLFDWDQQLLAATRMIKFLKPGVTDAVVLGGHIGSLKPGSFTKVTGGTRFLHNPETFQELWDEAGRTTGTKWEVSSTWISKITIDIPSFPDESRYLVYIARQIDLAVSE